MTLIESSYLDTATTALPLQSSLSSRGFAKQYNWTEQSMSIQTVWQSLLTQVVMFVTLNLLTQSDSRLTQSVLTQSVWEKCHACDSDAQKASTSFSVLTDESCIVGFWPHQCCLLLFIASVVIGLTKDGIPRWLPA